MTDFESLKKFYSDKKVLVTGHTGFKGSCLCMMLSLLGAGVYGYALKPETDPSLFEILFGRGMGSRNETELGIRLSDSALRAEYRPIEESRIGDVRDMESLETFYERVSPDIVIHMAAQPLVRVSYREPLRTYETNVLGTVHILECLRRDPICRSFLNVTTDKVYLNDLEPGTDHAFRESDPLDGADPYANSKSCSEIATHSYAASFLRAEGVAVSTARAGNCIGGGDFSLDRIIPDAVRAVSSGEVLKVRNPESVRPYQHVFEPLRVYLEIAMRQYLDLAYAGWYNVGPDASEAVTTGELADMFMGYFPDGPGWISLAELDAPRESGYLRLDNTLIKETFGYESTWDILDAVRAAAEWTHAWMESDTAANDTLAEQLNKFIKR